MRDALRKVLVVSVMLFFSMTYALNVNAAEVDSTASRAEWIHELVSTFDMKVEDGLMPDDYYGDISDSKYYNDILLAINFGVIDLEAGEDFRPDDAVTREFAAQTLNACLGYELEDAEYTMSDYEDLQYPQAAQIAINENWFKLADGAFQPDMEISLTEQSTMLNFAKGVLQASVIDENHQNVYEFAEGIIEITEGTPVELLSDTEIMIYDTSLELSEGDSIAVYSNGIAYTYKIIELEELAEGLFVTGEEIAYEDAVVSADAEGIIDVDLADFVPAEGVNVEVEYEEEVSTYARIAGTKKIKSVKFDENVGGGKVWGTITNFKVHYRNDKNGYKFATTGTATVGYTLSGSNSFTITVGYVDITGIGNIKVDVIYSASGSATLTYSYDFETGIEKNYGSALRKISEYSTPSWHFSANAEMKASCKVGFYIDIPCMANGEVYAEAGVKAEPSMEVYDDGKKPTTCIDLPAYIFVTAGYSVQVFGIDVAGDTIEIYNRKNSPCRVCYHIEDGNQVHICSRPESSSSVGKRKYYSVGAVGGGTYSGNCFVAPSVAEPIFEYSLDEDNNATITKYIGSVYCLTIPEELDGHPVVAIGDNAFKGNAYLGSVVIPDSVTKIDNGAFEKCANLTSIAMPDSITRIGDVAFSKCTSLTNVKLPKALKTLERQAFYNCDAITSIEIPKALESGGSSTWGGGPFDECDNLKEVTFETGTTRVASNLFLNCKSIESIDLPDSITEIEDGAFDKCTNLTSIKMSDSITRIGDVAFSNCTSLTNVKLPKALKTLERQAFYNCDAITRIEIPKALESGGSGAWGGGPFDECDNLKEVTFETGTTRVASNLFLNCKSIESIDLPDSITEIEDGAFDKCTNLTSIKMSDSITRIGDVAFSNCTSLTNVKLPKALKTLERQAFYNCDAIMSIEIPKALESGGSSAWGGGPFDECDNLKEATFETGTTHISNMLFCGCIGLEKIVFQDTITSIDNQAFWKCKGLKEVIIPDNVISMGTNVFNGCTNLTSVHLPNIRITITEGTFSGCNSLTKVNFPNTLETIQGSAFKNCTSLTEVILPGKVNTIKASAFAGCTGLTKVSIPASMRTIEGSAFSHCESLTDLSIAEGTTTIGANAFEYCVALEKVTLPDFLQSLGNYAFSYCDKLAEINIGAGLKIIPNYCFYQDPAIIKVVLPQQVTTINKYAFGNSTGLTDITINRNVATIDATAFSYPDKLTIHGVKGTYAETFASENGITFASLDAPATAIKLNVTELEIGRSESLQMSASITPTDSSDQFTWSSSDETVVTIDATGKLTAKALGTATIIAMAGDVIETCEVSVYEPVTSVSLNKSSYTGTIGDTLQLTEKIRPTNASYTTVKWNSSDVDIAEVTDSGLVTFKKYGTATITVTTDNKGKTATCKITVEPIAVTGVSLNSSAQTLGVGDTYQLVETITPDNATTKDVTWTSSKPAVATVENGLVTAVGEGTTIIVAKTQDGAKTASCTITVKNVLITGITLDKTTLEMETKTTQTLVASLTPSDASATSVVWSSDNEEVATVVNGNITALKEGTVTITAASKDGSCSASCVVTVTKKEDSATDDPTTEDPSKDDPATDDPSKDDPATDDPSKDDPTTENPSKDDPTTEDPSKDDPATDAPSKDDPTTDAPSKDEPTTESPSKDEPTTEAPSKDDPTTEAPSKDEPTTEAPSKDDPTTDKPANDEPSAEKPSTDKPSVDDSTTQQPTMQQPTTQAPATDVKQEQSTQAPSQNVNTQTPGQNTNAQTSGTSTQNGSNSSKNNVDYSSSEIKKVTKLSVKNKKSKCITIQWKWQASADGYQVQIATKKNFKQGKKTKNVYLESLTWKGLKKGKTYYVRVRAYQSGFFSKEYGSWSAVKKIKIQK